MLMRLLLAPDTSRACPAMQEPAPGTAGGFIPRARGVGRLPARLAGMAGHAGPLRGPVPQAGRPALAPWQRPGPREIGSSGRVPQGGAAACPAYP